MHQSILHAIREIPIVPTIEADTAQEALFLCEAFSRGGIKLVEIMFRTDAAPDAIRLVKQQMPEMIVGAGTILDQDTCQEALEAGADFIVSPGYDPALCKYCIDQEVHVIPGVMTPTEILQARMLNLHLLKFYPACISDAAALLKSYAGPFQDIEFLTTGGMSISKMSSFLSLNNVAAVGGGFLSSKEEIRSGSWKAVEARARQAVQVAEQIRNH